MDSRKQTLPPQKVIIGSIIIALVASFILLRSYFSLIIFATILAYMFNPVYQYFLKKTKGKHSRALSLTVIVVILLVTIPLVALLAITVNQAAQLLDAISSSASSGGDFQTALKSIIDTLNRQIEHLPWLGSDTLNFDQVMEWLKSAATALLGLSLSFITNFAGGIASFFTNIIILLFVFSSLLRNQKYLLSLLDTLNPLGKKLNNNYLQKMGAMTSAMIKGQFLIAVAQATMGTLSLYVIGFDYLAFWFVLLTFLSIIPLGGGIVLIPLGIILLLIGDIWQGLVILGTHFVITTNIDNILRPKFVPKTARLDPALTILSVFAGIGIFGFLGIIVGPVIMILIVTTINLYADYKKQTIKE